MTQRNVMITIRTSRIEVPHSEPDDECENEVEFFEAPAQSGEFPEPTEMLVEGKLITGRDRVELVYEEPELSGMDGSVTSIGFDRTAPALISMFRTGAVESALIFEEGKRHFSLYNTPFSNFQICVCALHVKNDLFATGCIELDYIIEIQGVQAERCRMTISARPGDNPFA